VSKNLSYTCFNNSGFTDVLFGDVPFTGTLPLPVAT